MARFSPGIFVQGSRQKYLMTGVVSALISLAAAQPGFAQSANPATAALPPAGASGVPTSILNNALTGIGGNQALREYLGTADQSVDEITRRASALITALGGEKGDAAGDSEKAQQILAAVSRVATLASRKINSASIVQFAVEDNFRPKQGSIALDFGPQDGTVMPGFERVAPTDRRISGDGVRGLRRPDDNSLLADGLSGVRKIEVDVPNGEYRIVLMTQNLGDSSLVSNPFGREVRVNGEPLLIERGGTESWKKEAMLSSGNSNNQELQNAGGFRTGDISGTAQALYARQQGGAIILEGRATGGKLVTELRGGFEETSSYLTGLVVEPIQQVSSVVLSETARELIVPKKQTC
ncbi:MAG: hypothetical protein GKS01_08285 [Alphaproteobacteria bacterium]|nr:hypothetical protein [Alphaproteobacteria bacterium]